MKYLLAFVRIVLLVVYTLALVLSLFILYWVIGIFNKDLSVRIIHYLTPALAWPLRVILGIRVRIFNRERMPKDRGFLMASNHLGYIEVIALLKIRPMAFVAKDEIEKWPVIGAVVKAVGTVFVDRRTGGLSDVYIKKVSDVVNNRINFWFAPEKTTSDGTWLRPFSSALFVVANQLKCPLVPAVFVLRGLNGKPIDEKRRSQIAWATDKKGLDTPFFKHFLRFLTLGIVRIDMHVLEPVVPDYDDKDIEARRAFSNEIHRRMSEELAKHEPDFDRERTA
ncbi:MAG: 1-acyl-sn-glycerol-3-phosphate acyltransferase [Candidatus Marinimicrobia bacterium]|nr:1-acyl-sn-glycerol-3-phosphate acyltransferase [Candidatus Neomarinimicrobiota bacterium]